MYITVNTAPTLVLTLITEGHAEPLPALIRTQQTQTFNGLTQFSKRKHQCGRPNIVFIRTRKTL